MTIKKFYNKNQRGLSLIEMMVVVAVLGVIILGLVTFFTGGTKSWVAGQSQLTAQRNARQAMDRMVREIRKGKKVTDDSTGISVTVEIPPLGEEDEYEVTYSWSGNPGDSIYRNSNPLIDNVKSLEFKYFKKNVHIVLEVDVDNDKKPDITLNSEVNLRNYGLQ